MPFKPIPLKDFQKQYLDPFGWSLDHTAAIDPLLIDENGNRTGKSIKVTHGRRTKGKEVSAHSVQKTIRILKERGKIQ